MSLAGGALIAILLGLSALHLYWGVGGLWPGHDPMSLRLMVVGNPGPMPPPVGPLPGWASASIVAALLATAAAIVFARHTGLMQGGLRWIIIAGYVALILVFALRGLAPYISPAFEYARGAPFYEMNRLYYAPLCLFIAALLLFTFPRANVPG